MSKTGDRVRWLNPRIALFVTSDVTICYSVEKLYISFRSKKSVELC